MEFTAKQQKIIDVSISLIAEKGIQNLTIKNIAQAIGTSEPAVYRHFENKFDIIMCILESFDFDANSVLSNKTSTGALENIRTFLFDRYKRCSDKPNIAKVLFSEEYFQNDELLSKKILNIMHNHKGQIDAIILEGQKTGEIRRDIDPKSIFRIIFGSARLLIKQWALSNYSFNLLEEGSMLWEAQSKILTK